MIIFCRYLANHTNQLPGYPTGVWLFSAGTLLATPISCQDIPQVYDYFLQVPCQPHQSAARISHRCMIIFCRYLANHTNQLPGYPTGVWLFSAGTLPTTPISCQDIPQMYDYFLQVPCQPHQSAAWVSHRPLGVCERRNQSYRHGHVPAERDYVGKKCFTETTWLGEEFSLRSLLQYTAARVLSTVNF
jgi:hypothetical protein